MGVQSIRTAVQEGDVAGNHLLIPPGKMSVTKMDAVGKLHDLAKEIWALTETLEYARHFCAARCFAPLIVYNGSFAGGVGILDLLDLQTVFRHVLNVIRHGLRFPFAHDVSFPIPM